MDNKGMSAIPGGLMMARERVLIASIARTCVISCLLLIYVLPASGQSLIGVTSCEQFRDWTELPGAKPYLASTIQGLVEPQIRHALAARSLQKGDVLHDEAAKAGSPEMNPSPKANPAISIERKVKDAQLTIRATAVTENALVEDDKFQVPPGGTVAWEVELSVYNMRASTGWRYWDARLEFGPELKVEAVDSPGAIEPVPRGGSPIEPTLTISRDENTRKTKVSWSWHSLENNTSSDFLKRARAAIRLRVRSSQESGYRQGSYVFCDNAAITYMTGAKRPKETTYELEPIVVSVTSL